MNTTCLTYDQIIKYSENSLTLNDRKKTYEHLTSCELCSSAVNGFTEIGFSISDIVAIDQIIDKKSNVNPLTLSKILIVSVSILSIFGFYFFSNSLTNSNTAINVRPNNWENISQHNQEQKVNAVSKKDLSKIEIKNTIIEKSQKHFDIPEKLPTISISSIEISKIEKNQKIDQYLTDGGFYIHNFKVAHYRDLYFTRNIQTTFVGYSSSIENKNAESNLTETEVFKHMKLKDILEQGLSELENEAYEKAIQNFNLLIEENPNDENALFYSGIAYYHLNEFSKASRYFEKTSLISTTFIEEAEWHLAMCYMKTKNNTKGVELLSKIVSEEGFYAEKAKMILKELK